MKQGDTRGTQVHRSRRSPLARLIPVVAMMGLSTVPLADMAAQGVVRVEDVRVGSEQERYLRALSALAPSASWTMRPTDGVRMFEALRARQGPWRLEGRAREDGLRFLGAGTDVTLNSGLPSSRPDASAWSGRGVNLSATGAADWTRGRVRVRIAPMAWYAQNAAFDLVPTDGLFPWSDATLPATIDLPQRFGDGSTMRLDPGESAVELRLGKARLALTSAASHLGPGSDHSLIMQGDAGGIPRLEVTTTDGVRTRIGTLRGQVAWGRTPHTAWAPGRRTRALFTSWLMGTWQPAFADRLEVGMLRLTHRDWEDMTARELLVPFGSVYSSRWVGGSYETENDNQMASVFAHLRVPEAGLEFFGEFGKGDRSASWRDQVLEPEHASAWLIGAQKAWRDGAGRLWALNLTTVSGAIAPITRFRGQAMFYEHSRMTQGHTLRGQLLGTPLLQREGGAEVRLDRYDGRGRVGVLLATRSLPNELGESIAPANVRQEWTAMWEMMRWTASGAWRVRAGAVADLGYSPTAGDAFNLHLALGWDFR